MALRPDTPETRMVPVAGRQFAERRLIRGVGAKERAVGYAWGRMTSRQKQHYGNQRNFAGRMQQEANRRAIAAEEDREEMLRNQGREMAGKTSQPATNHAASVIKPETSRFIQNEVDKDMHPEGRPARKDPATALNDALEQGRIRDYSHFATRDNFPDEKQTDVAYERGWDDPNYQPAIPDDPYSVASARRTRLLAKGYQMESLRRARLRGQYNRNPALVADSRGI